ncbi:MAG: hypothetical protein M3Q61_04620 [Chloroflexota bacterium]|nr:hypothetical protein [Chloroflexota bacterium]
MSDLPDLAKLAELEAFLPDLAKLAELEAFMRAHGIEHLKVDGIELNLGPRPPLAPTPESEGKRVQRNTKSAADQAEWKHRTLFAHSRVRPRRIARKNDDT